MSQQPGTERRSNTRFPITLELRYSYSFRRGPGTSGTGRSIDLSSSGLSFNADRPLAVGENLDVSINWPVPLHGGVQLQLMLSGSVVRTNGTITALRVQRHEFRTRSLGPKLVTPHESAS